MLSGWTGRWSRAMVRPEGRAMSFILKKKGTIISVSLTKTVKL
jgi:hypothetical protein